MWYSHYNYALSFQKMKESMLILCRIYIKTVSSMSNCLYFVYSDIAVINTLLVLVMKKTAPWTRFRGLLTEIVYAYRDNCDWVPSPNKPPSLASSVEYTPLQNKPSCIMLSGGRYLRMVKRARHIEELGNIDIKD